MNWQQVSAGVGATDPLLLNGSANVRTELSETVAWAEFNTLWAADARQLADGRFYMNYNACKGDSARSALGIAVQRRQLPARVHHHGRRVRAVRELMGCALQGRDAQ